VAKQRKESHETRRVDRDCVSASLGATTMRCKLLVLGILMSLMTCGFASAQEAEGDWIGILKTPARNLRVAFHIHKDAQGKLMATMDSLDQSALGVPVASVTANGGSLVLVMPDLGARYEGKWDPGADQWKGVLNQRGATVPLDLSPAKPASVADAQLNGDWEGTLDVGGRNLTIIFHIRGAEDGTVGSLDVVEQSAKGIPVSVRRIGDRLMFDVMAIGAMFDGTLTADTIRGRWTQSGGSLMLTLQRRLAGAPTTELRRPQVPVRPYPYIEEQVAYDNPAAGVRLAATMTLPRGSGPFPAALLIAGSGPNDRDETIAGHKPFLVLADHLTRQGIAVLRTDKRGVGKSTGDYSTATGADFASDVEAGIAYLKTRRDIDANKIGLIGHSEGGLIAPAVASRNPSVGWVVMMAGPGTTGEEVMYAQERLIAQAMGANSEQIDRIAAWNRRVFEIVKTESDPQKARELIKTLAMERGIPTGQAEAQARQAASGWFRYFLTYDPVPALQRLRCPVLAIAGEKDLQVPPGENLPAIRNALTGTPDAEVVELPGLNHLFQTAKSGAPIEYGEIEQTMSPLALDTMSRWITGHTK
jgi:hypothetical protein